MASPTGPIQISVGDIVEYQGRCCVVQAIENPLGFDKYTVQDLVDGAIMQAHIHQLDKPEFVEMVDSAIEEWSAEHPSDASRPTATTSADETENRPTELPAQTWNQSDTSTNSYFPSPQVPLWQFQSPSTSSITTENIPSPTPVKRRHVCPSDKELDKLAASRLSTHTDRQTQWGVKIFKGKQTKRNANTNFIC